MTGITMERAREILALCNARDVDFHTLGSEAVDRLLIFADEYRYRAPRNANGSRGRYFHAYLSRLAHGPKTYVEFRLWVNYGQGWEHECSEASLKDVLAQVKVYRANCPEYPVKWTRARLRIEASEA